MKFIRKKLEGILTVRAQNGCTCISFKWSMIKTDYMYVQTEMQLLKSHSMPGHITTGQSNSTLK